MTPTPNPLRAALAKIERAEKAVDDLCQGRLRWEMRVPAEPDHDPDLIISEALRAARAALQVDADAQEEEPPFVIRVFEKQSWVPLSEAVNLHESQQRTELALVALRNELALRGNEPCDDCGSTDRWLHWRTCGRYYGGASLDKSKPSRTDWSNVVVDEGDEAP